MIKEIGIGFQNDVQSVKLPPSSCRFGNILLLGLSYIIAFVSRNSTSLLCTSSLDLSEIESLDPAVFFTQVGIINSKNLIFYILFVSSGLCWQDCPGV